MAGTKAPSNHDHAISVGIIGAGYGLKSLLPLLRLLPEYRVVCVATKQGVDQRITTNPLQPRDFFYTTPNDLIQNTDLELVLIASPPSTHEEFAIAAIAAGKNVYCEKPVGLNSDSTNKILQASQQSEKICTVGFQFRYDPMIRWIKNRIRLDELGELIRIEIRWETSGAYTTPKQSWRNNLNMGGGVLRDFGIHVFDYLTHIEAISYGSTSGKFQEMHNFKSNIESRDIQDVNFSGVFGKVEFDCIISRSRTKPIGHSIRVIGTKSEVHAHHHPPFGPNELILEVLNGNGVRKHFIPDEFVGTERNFLSLNHLDSRNLASSHLFLDLAQTIRGAPNEALPSLEDALSSQKLVEEAESALFLN